MKKILLFIAIAVFSACTGGQYGKGGDNAAQYVREQMPDLTKNAESVEVTGCDSIGFIDIEEVSRDLKMKETDADLEIITFKQLRDYADSIDKVITTPSNMVYIVTVTAKSSKKTNVQVIMESDGVTPAVLMDEYSKKLKPFS